MGTYDADNINAGGPLGDLIQQTIKEDFARLLVHIRLKLVLFMLILFRVEVYYQTLNVQSVVQSEKYTVSIIRYKSF